MRKIIVFCLLAVFAQPVLAKLYKCKDAEGNTVYTDEPCADGKELKLPPLHTYTPVIIPPAFPTTNEADKKAVTYESLKILEPGNDKPVYNNTGTVTVSYQLKPSLNTSLGHQFSIALDGKQLKTKGVTNQIQLQNLDRGSHSVQIFVVDKDNGILLSSPTVTFHLRQDSLINTPLPGSPQKAPQVPAAPAAPRATGL